MPYEGLGCSPSHGGIGSGIRNLDPLVPLQRQDANVNEPMCWSAPDTAFGDQRLRECSRLRARDFPWTETAGVTVAEPQTELAG